MRPVAPALIALLLLIPLVPNPAHALPLGGLYGGDLRVALRATATLNPLQFPQNRIVQELAYDSLTRLSTDHLPVPWLASSWTVNVPAKTITMTLRAATWPDLSAITAADVAWSFSRYVSAGVVTGLTPTAAGPSTVVFTFTSGGGEFLGNAATFPVAWKDQSGTYAANGPFVVDTQSATAIRLVANDRHWKGRPLLDAVTFQFPYTLVRSADGSTQANDAACAFLKGQVNLIAWPLSQNDLTNERDCAAGFGGWSDGVNRTLLNPDPARTMPFAAVAENPGLQFLYLGMNTQRAPLTDPTLRVALSMAIDRDLVAGTYGGAVEPKVDIADSPVSPANLAWFNASVPKYRVPRAVVGSNAVPSLEPVNAFLDAAGYLDRTGDGFRDTPAGTPFNFTLLTFDQATDPRVAKYLDLITKFRAIGINVVQREHTPAELRALEASDAFDLVVDIEQAEGEPSFLFDLLHAGSPGNVVNVASPALDALLEAARDALDPVARRQAVLDAEGWVALQVPLAPIVHYRAETTYDRTTFEGWVDGLGGIANFWTFTTAHVTQMGPLTVTVDALPPSIRSMSGTDILVRAWDAEANAVAGVDVELRGVGLAATSGVTDAQGAFATRFTAPSVDVAQDFTIAADAAKAGYGGASGATTVTVHPLAHTFTVLIGKDSPTLASGNTTGIRVQVLDDQTLLGVPAANVTIAISPEGLTASVGQATGVTDGNGFLSTTFTADVTVASRFVITATATASGYETSSGTTAIDVTARPAGGTAPPTPALDTLSMVAVVATLAAVYGAWQRRKWVQRRP